MKKLISFVKKHPWLLAKCLFLTNFVCRFLVSKLNTTMLFLLELNDKDPNTPPLPPPAPPEPTYSDIFLGPTRPRPWQVTWQPSWMRASLKSILDHPIIKLRFAREAFLAQQKAEFEAKEKERLAQEAAAATDTAPQVTDPSLVVSISNNDGYTFTSEN
jgi:hypothetical protein